MQNALRIISLSAVSLFCTVVEHRKIGAHVTAALVWGMEKERRQLFSTEGIFAGFRPAAEQEVGHRIKD